MPDVIPARDSLEATPLGRALLRWQRAAGPYWPYVCAAPFIGELAPKVGTGRREGFRRGLRALIAALPPGERPAIFVDLRPTAILPSAPALNRHGFRVAPVIQRWMSPRAVIPCARLAEQLVAHSFGVRPVREARGVVFVLDGDRSRGGQGPGVGGQGAPRLFDNRYQYPMCRFPPASFLGQQGITSVRLVCGSAVGEDMQPYLQRLAEAGLEAAIARLDTAG